jgi:phage terminase large subunit-like protein
MSQLSDEELAFIQYDWSFWARPSQRMPDPLTMPGVQPWAYWLIMAGRGFGKTRIGAEACRQWAQEYRYVNIIGATADDARDIMIEGESGILSICPIAERPIYQPSKRRLVWPTGAISLIFTADEPERLRGKQHMKVWMDEIASWRYAEAFDQTMFGLRLGDNPQAVITTTPKPVAIVRELLDDENCIVTRGTTYENKVNLARTFFTKIVTKYEGTRLGRQELNAELLEDNPGALWSRSLIERSRVKALPPAIIRVVTGVDPAVSKSETSDETGIITACMDGQSPPHFYIMRDDSLVESPDAWCAKVCEVYHAESGDRVVAEVNNGGELVEALLRTKDRNVSYSAVHASRGKVIRAEPVAALYEQGRVHHVGSFGTLEDQLCDWNPKTDAESPDRLDALVWAVTELASGGNGLIDLWKKQAEDNKARTDADNTDDPRIQPQADKDEQFGTMNGKISTPTNLGKVEKSTKAEASTPACPTCGNTILSRYSEGYWKCNNCGTDGRDPDPKMSK